MALPAALKKPGIEVEQVVKPGTPTIVEPSFAPCVVGPCFEIRELFASDGSVDANSQLSTPATITGTMDESGTGTYAVGNRTLKVRVNNGAETAIKFPGTTNDQAVPSSLVIQEVKKVTGLTAEVVAKKLQLSTVSKGDSAKLEITSGSDAQALTGLGFSSGTIAEGTGSYKNNRVDTAFGSFPNPRGNIAELDFGSLTDKIRAFIVQGGTARELSKSQATLQSYKQARRVGSTATVIDESPDAEKTYFLYAKGTGTSKTRRLYARGANAEIVLKKTGNTTLSLTIQAKGDQKVSSAAFVFEPDTTKWANFQGREGNKLKAASITGGVGASSVAINADVTLEITVGTTAATAKPSDLATLINTTAVVKDKFIAIGVDDGTNTIDNAVAPGNPAFLTGGYNPLSFTNADASDEAGVGGHGPAGAIVLGKAAAAPGTEVDFTKAPNTTIQLRINGGELIEVTFAGADDTNTEVRDAINAKVAALTSVVSGALKFTVPTADYSGYDNSIEFVGGTAIKFILGPEATYKRKFFGKPHIARVGDELYETGTKVGVVTAFEELAVGTRKFAGAVLVLDTDVTLPGADQIGEKFKVWYLRATGITSTEFLPTANSRPVPELQVDATNKKLKVKHNVGQDSGGVPLVSPSFPLSITYKALRLDVSDKAKDPKLQKFKDTTEITDLIGPVTPENRLAYGLFLAKQNAPDMTVSGIGVSVVTADAPDGTLEAYTSAAGFLESKEVYAVAPMTDEQSPITMWATHVDALSGPTQKRERVVLLNEKQPTEKNPKTVGSGKGDTGADATKFVLQLSSLNLGAAFQAAGITIPAGGTFPVTDGIYLDIAKDALRYNITNVDTAANTVTVNTTFAPGENEDKFYSSANPPTGLVNESATLFKRGAKLTSTDKDDIATAMGEKANALLSKRVLYVQPDKAMASVAGLETEIPGFFAAAIVAGATAQQHPAQPFTNFPFAGLTGVKGSNDKFSEKQMDIAAGGGVFWMIQEVAGGAVSCRHQLTTNTKSITLREYSIVRAADWLAKLYRANLKASIGRFNITPDYLTDLATRIQALNEFAVQSRVFKDVTLDTLVQDKDFPDTIAVDVTVDSYKPANYIRIRIFI